MIYLHRTNLRLTARLFPHRSGAILSIELLFVLPVIGLILLGTVEDGMLLSVDQRLAVASREGARVGAQGGSAAEVTAAAQLNLGNPQGRLYQNAVIAATLTDSQGNPLPSGQPVTVIVYVQNANTVVPDLLSFVGLSIKNQTLAAQTVMRKE